MGNNQLSLNMDAFSDGQMASKLWLCEELEKTIEGAQVVWVLGSWYGLLPFLLLSRGRLSVEKFVLVDLDKSAVDASKKILNHWVFQKKPQIDFVVRDCNEDLSDLPRPTLVINTSTEHMLSQRWWSNLPKGVFYAFQGTDYEHPEHVLRAQDLNEFSDRFRETTLKIYLGKKFFDYFSFSYNRFMIIGRK